MINLLQGDFAITRSKTTTHRLWRIARNLVIASCAIWIMASIAEYAIFKYQLHNLEQQTATLYRHVFPHATDIVEPKLRIKQVSKNLQNSRSGGVFLSLLAEAGQQLNAQHNAITINHIRFANNTLTLDVQSSNFQHVENFITILRQKQLNIKQTNARTTRKGVSARILLSRVNQ